MDRVQYYGEPDQWRVVAIFEALKVRAGELDLLEQILEVACHWCLRHA